MKLADMKPAPRKPKGPRVIDSRLKLLLNISQLRSDRGVTLRECQKASGIDQATLWRIECGAEPTLVNALRMAKFLGCAVDEIWALNGKAQTRGLK